MKRLKANEPANSEATAKQFGLSADQTKLVITFLLTLSFIATVYGAIPFYSIPSINQILWCSGFAQSFCNSGWPGIFAINFSLPNPAPISFGLPGVFLQSTLLHFLPLNAPDSYAIGAVVWLALSLVGCIAFGNMLGLNSTHACLAGLSYLTLPLIWKHALYSMLSVGFALLPFYLSVTFRLAHLSHPKQKNGRALIANALLYFTASFLAAFIDGYTYVMFLCATLLILLVSFLEKEKSLAYLLQFVAPTVIGSTAVSYFCYVLYERGAAFTKAPLDFFRTFGADLLMLIVPRQGASWLFDILHLSTVRNSVKYFGDPSVWTTTFCLPFVITGLIGYWLARKNQFALPLLLISLLGFYLALGPSFKINVLRPLPQMSAGPESSFMTPDLSPIETGTAVLDIFVPGFNSMRASYRWIGLLFVGCYGATILLLKTVEAKHRFLSFSIMGLLILTNLPNLSERAAVTHAFRSSMLQLISDLEPLNEAIGKGRRVVFYPRGNDFLVNYLSAAGKYYTYNIGGDKNMETATSSYPASVTTFFATPFNPGFDQEIEHFLAIGDADCVVIPYFNLHLHPRAWPPKETDFIESDGFKTSVRTVSAVRAQFAPVIDRLSKNPKFEVKVNPLFAVITPKHSF